MKEALKIVCLSVIGAMVYGVLQDQITARICLEYFTIGHPTLIETTSITVLALAWGMVATWWFGLLLGIPLAWAAQWGSRPKRSAGQLAFPMAFLLVRVAIFAFLGGLAGYFFVKWGWIEVVAPEAIAAVTGEVDLEYAAVLWAHWVAYGSAAVEALLLCRRTWKGRKPQSR